MLRWAENPRNRVAAFRALQLVPGIGPRVAGRIYEKFSAGAHAWRALASGAPEFDALVASLGDPQAPWAGQVGRVREWLEPQLERLYDAVQARAGDLWQLERIAQQFAERERFLTELALDPPRASGDLAGAPHLDEDYLVLSTIHSAKGQEWEAVYVLNVADGSFPSEFATGRPEAVEEERRLLYVAMTRAKSELHLVAPLKYYVTQQPRMGDAHVYGARSRFLTRAVLARLKEVAWPEAESAPAGVTRRAAPVDVAAKLRGMW